MTEEPEVVETAEAAATEKPALAPAVSFHSATKPEEITQAEEPAEASSLERTVKEDKGDEALDASAAEAPKDGEDQGDGTKLIEPGKDNTDGSDSSANLSPEELRMRKKQERKERLKKILANRFVLESNEKLVVFQGEENAKDDNLSTDFVLEDPETIVANFYEPDQDVVTTLEDTAMDTAIETPRIYDALPDFSDALDAEGLEDILQRDSTPLNDEDMSHDAISIVSTKSTKDPDTVKQKALFLQDFDLPSLSDISEEHLAAQLSRIKSVASMGMELKDQGSFVNPLTGELLSTSSSSSSSSLEFASDNEEHAPDAGSEGSLDLSDIPEFPEVTLPLGPQAQSVLTFAEFTMTFRASHFHDDQDTEDPLTKFMELEKITAEFLNDLLKEIVVGVEVRNYENLLRRRFDKKKLLKELKSITNAHVLEKNMNLMLNTRMHEYFKRLKNNRVFAKLSPIDEINFYTRYMDALAVLDHLKKKLEMSKLQHGIQLSKVLFDLHSAQQVTSFVEDRLEKTIRKTLIKPDREQLARIVEMNLRAIASKRREISDTRLFLITRKHTLGNIMKVGSYPMIRSLFVFITHFHYYSTENHRVGICNRGLGNQGLHSHTK